MATRITTKPKPTLIRNCPIPCFEGWPKSHDAATLWWDLRRPEIVEDFDREIYGRVPENTPKVNWEVTSTATETNGTVPCRDQEAGRPRR